MVTILSRPQSVNSENLGMRGHAQAIFKMLIMENDKKPK